MSTRILVFPFDLFGSSGSARGAELLGDELREVLADNRRETIVTRARAYSDQVRIKQIQFENIEQYSKWRQQGRRQARQALDDSDFFLWISGNHLGCLPVYDELTREPDAPLVVQLDAHLDIHNFSGYSTEPSHSNFLLHCSSPLPPLLNVGHRELLLTPDYIHEYYRAVHPASDLIVDIRPVAEQVRQACALASSVVFDIDCDVLDPAYFPAVSRPVPFGLSPAQLLGILEAAWSPKVQGVMLSEFDPVQDQNDRSLSTLVWLIEYLLLKRYEKVE